MGIFQKNPKPLFLKTAALLFGLLTTVELLYLTTGKKMLSYLLESGVIDYFSSLPEAHSIDNVMKIIDYVMIKNYFIGLALIVSLILAGLYYKQIYNLYSKLIQNRKISILILILISLILTGVIAGVVLQGFPNSGDEYSYFHQGMTYAEGRLWNDTHPLTEFFQFNHTIQKDNRWIGKYAPGWPLLLAIGSILHCPKWLVNPLLGALSLFILYLLGKRLYDKKTALLAVIMMLVTPFFVFNSASYFAHTSAMLLGLLFYYFGLKFMDSKNWGYGILAGLWIGLLFINRSYSATLICIPYIVYFFWHKPKQEKWQILLVVAGAIPFIVFLLFYNWKITGHPLLMTFTWYDPSDKIGFVQGHTIIRGLYFVLKRLLHLAGWTSPVLILMYFLFWKNKRIRSRESILLSWTFVAFIVGFIFYWHYGGRQYGPRYWFEGLPFLILPACSVLYNWINKKRESRFFKAVAIAGILFSVQMIMITGVIEHRELVENSDIFRSVQENELKNAIVFITSGTGVVQEMSPHDLVRNGINYSGDVIYAHNLGDQNLDLMAHYPNRDYYTYLRNKSERTGRIELLSKPYSNSAK